KPDTKPSLPLKSYAGTYEERAYGKAEVAVEDDKLTVRCGKLAFRLEHYHFDTFTAVPVEPADEVVSFDRSTFEAQFRLGTNGEGGPAYSRFVLLARVRYFVTSSRSIPGRSGNFASSITSVTLLPWAISRACPARPKPVMSVAALTPTASIASHAPLLSVTML